ncbi:ComEC/Rec2 family competence protein [Agromyces sp. NPDC058110]|uniref:ComEC/Rec2 family competence protein n=1 Tax=Agromyces sp. NPDC058110 TaxID=3346345 RepID=UPI0036D91EBC
MHDLRLLLPACSAWVAAWAAITLPSAGVDAQAVAWSLWGAAAAVLVVLAGGRVLGRRRRGCDPTGSDAALARIPPARARRRVSGAAVAAGLLVALSCSAMAATSAATQLAERARSPLATAAETRSTVAVVVEATNAPQPMRAAVWAADEPMVEIDGVLVSVGGEPVGPVPVTVGVPETTGVEWGTRVALRVRVQPLPAEEPNAFRLVAPDRVEVVGGPPPWLDWASTLRHGFADAAKGLDGDGAALVPGLAIGDTSAVGAELDAAMKASSLTHLTAVSGANCAIVTAAAFGLAAACGFGRRTRVVVALVALAGFVVLVTPQASVVRAAAMAVVILVGVASSRRSGGVSALSLAVVLVLAQNPWLARDYGFALSAAATAGLLLLAGPLARRLADVMPAPLAVSLAVPVAAQLACQPVLVLLDPAVAVYGVPANLLAAPAAPVGTIVGMLGCLVLPFLPSVGFAFLQVAWVPASWIALVAHGATALPGGRLPWLPDAVGAVTMLLATCAGLWLLLSRRRRPAVRRAVATALVLLVAVPLGVVLGPSAVARATHPGRWDVANCDVGQGDAVLVRSEGATALFDTGPDPSALRACLELLDVETIDLLVLTHWDADHVAGSPAVVGMVSTVVHGPLDGERSARVLDPLVAGGADAVEVESGRRGALGASRWRVLWPPPETMPGNDASVVLELDGPFGRALLLGDLGEEAQSRMLRAAPIGPVDLVKVAHHGSADQSERLYEELSATIGIIGVGVENGYGHPTDGLLDLLAQAGTVPVRSDRSGTALLTSNGDGGFALWTERGPGAVAPRP